MRLLAAAAILALVAGIYSNSNSSQPPVRYPDGSGIGA